MSFESIVNRIETLPPLPESVRRLEALFAEGDPEMKAIVAIIESDPVLTADILAKVNSPLYSYSKQIVSVMQAVTLFGLAAVRGMVLHSAVHRSFEIDMRPYGISNETFSKISAMQSALMFQWYMGVEVETAKMLLPVAFLMEMGKVVIAKELVESSYSEVFSQELSVQESVAETEKLFTDTTSSEVCALLFEHWYFEEHFVESMRALDREEVPDAYKTMVDALRIVQSAVNVKAQLSDESIDEAAAMVSAAGLDSERFSKAAQRVKQKFEAR